jgi:hypothetical protein
MSSRNVENAAGAPAGTPPGDDAAAHFNPPSGPGPGPAALQRVASPGPVRDRRSVVERVRDSGSYLFTLQSLAAPSGRGGRDGATREVFQAEVAVQPTALARLLAWLLGPWVLRVALRRGFAVAMSALALSTTFIGTLPDLAGDPMAEWSSARSNATVALLSLVWGATFALIIPVLDRSLVALVSRSFNVAYIAFNTAVFCALSLWNVNVHMVDTNSPQPLVRNYNFSVSLYASAMPVFLLWDAVISPPMRTRLAQAAVMLAMIAGALRNLTLERTTESNYNLQEICVPYCATVRTLALSALTNTTVFVAKALLAALLTGRMIQVTLPVYLRETEDRQATVLSVKVPTGNRSALSARTLRCYVAPATGSATGLPADEVEVGVLPRWRVFPWRRLARLVRHPLYPFLVAGTQIVFTACEIAHVTREAAVAVPILASFALTVATELTRIDGELCRVLLTHFETYFVFANMLVYVIASSVATRTDAGSLESPWSVTLHAVSCFAGAVWVALVDASRIPRVARVMSMSCALGNLIRWMIVELVHPQLDPAPEVCMVFCSRLSSLALGALFNLTIFVAKELYSAAFSEHLSVICMGPTVQLVVNQQDTVSRPAPPPLPPSDARLSASSAIELIARTAPEREVSFSGAPLSPEWRVFFTEGVRRRCPVRPAQPPCLRAQTGSNTSTTKLLARRRLS